MFSARKSLLVAAGACAAFAITAAPASATSVQTAAGVPYTGAITGSAVGNAVFTTGLGTITCNEAPLSGTITNSGATATPATGQVTAADFTNNGNQACPDTLDVGGGFPTHENFTANVPWAASIDWISDNTAGTPNGTITLSGVTILAELDAGDCTYRGDAGDTGGTTNQVVADVYNHDNTPSGDLEIRFVNEPLETVDGSPCTIVPTASVNLTYAVQGAAAVDLRLRESPPVVPVMPTCSDLSVSTPYQTALGVQLSCTGTAPLTYAISTPPANGATSGLDTATGAVTYTPNAGFSGVDTFQYTASNGVGISMPKTVTVTVGDPPTTPPGTTPSTPATPTTPSTPAGKAKQGKCGKAKKGASAAKKKCKKKKKK